MRMRAYGAPTWRLRNRWLGPGDGADDEPTQSRDEDDRDAVHPGGQGRKGRILDDLCATTGLHRNHARKALKAALRPKIVKPRASRPPKYGPKVVAALIFCWAVLGMPTGKRLAPMLSELVAILRRFGELDVDDDTAALLAGMSAATIDRRLAGERKKHQLKGRSRTKPGSLLKSQIPIRTWADWDDAVPGFVEIDLVAHDGGDPRGDFCHTLSVTDIATTWTEPRAVRNKAQKWVFAALTEIVTAFPFDVLGIDNGSEFINDQLLRYCNDNQITFTRSRPGNKNDGAHIEEKNWSVVRQAVGYHRYDTERELLLLNEMYTLLRLQVNFFAPHQKLVSKVRDGAKVTKRYDTARTAYQRVLAEENVPQSVKDELTRQCRSLNPAQIRRDIIALSDKLLTLVKAKHQPTPLPSSEPTPTRAKSGEATKPRSRAS
jgi:hypothetical protein